jgi:mRNA interferase MazF
MTRRNEEFVPDSGGKVWIDLNTSLGHVQRGCRQALVLSPKSYNSKMGLMVVCPLNRSIKGYPFEVPLSQSEDNSVALADQVTSLVAALLGN